jgi:ATP-dependent Clp protease adaptor protein ClpS
LLPIVAKGTVTWFANPGYDRLQKRGTRFELKTAYVSVFRMSGEPLWKEVAMAEDAAVTAFSAPNNAGPPMVDEPTIEKETRSKEDVDLPWQVVVHNDPVNLMSYVTMVFQRVFGYPREKAERHMLEVHHKGRSILWSGMRERAELYVQQLHGYLLLATLEKTV